MSNPLERLAVELHDCRLEGHKMNLELVLRSARILGEARVIAKNRFVTWLREKARMDRKTALSHLRVASFVQAHVELTPQIASLSIAKVYALSRLDLETARGLLEGAIRLSTPLDELTDLEFKKEFRDRFPSKRPHHTRLHVFQSTYSVLVRAERALKHAARQVGRLDPIQRERLRASVDRMHRSVLTWSGVA